MLTAELPTGLFMPTGNYRVEARQLLDGSGAVPLCGLGERQSGCGCAGTCGGAVSLVQLVGASQWLDALANRTVFGLDPDEQQRLKDMIYEIWSGPAAASPDSAGRAEHVAQNT